METCRKALRLRRARDRSMRRQNGYSLYIMAEVILKNLKKVYPNAESKKTKKGEPQKKDNLQNPDEHEEAVKDFNLHIAAKE